MGKLKINRDTTIDIKFKKESGQILNYTINIMPSTFQDFETTGESVSAGDFYLTTYYESGPDYIFKLNNKGELIFYKKTGDIAFNFKKAVNSRGEVRYTYLQTETLKLCDVDGVCGCCLVVMDKDYREIDRVYSKLNGNKIQSENHDYVYFDDGHYILQSATEVSVDVPSELVDRLGTRLSVLDNIVTEIKNGQILWQFRTSEHDDFLRLTNLDTVMGSPSGCKDYAHINCTYVVDENSVLCSFRNTSSIVKISRQTGEIIWTLHGFGEGDFELTEEQMFSKQHRVSITADGSILFYNNGLEERWLKGDTNSSIIKIKLNEETHEVESFEKGYLNVYAENMGSVQEVDAENQIYVVCHGGKLTPRNIGYSVVEYDAKNEVRTFTFGFVGRKGLYNVNKY